MPSCANALLDKMADAKPAMMKFQAQFISCSPPLFNFASDQGLPLSPRSANLERRQGLKPLAALVSQRCLVFVDAVENPATAWHHFGTLLLDIAAAYSGHFLEAL
jgi:hypothetical protein